MYVILDFRTLKALYSFLVVMGQYIYIFIIIWGIRVHKAM